MTNWPSPGPPSWAGADRSSLPGEPPRANRFGSCASRSGSFLLALPRSPSVTRALQLHLAPENPIDAHRVSQHDRHANDGPASWGRRPRCKWSGCEPTPGCSERDSATSPNRTTPPEPPSPRRRKRRPARRVRGGFRVGLVCSCSAAAAAYDDVRINDERNDGNERNGWGV